MKTIEVVNQTTNPKLMLCLTLVVGGALFACLNIAECQTNSNPQWVTFADTNRHFHFEYPPSWKINAETGVFMHYREVFVAVNSFGAARFTLRDQLSPATNPLPAGAVYFDIGWWEYLAPRFGQGVHEMEAADLSTLLKRATERNADDLVVREIAFDKWGRHWSIMVHLRPPVSQANRQSMERILKSFRFDGVPAGDPVWAIGEARKHLPPKADPDQYTREGGSSVYYSTTRRNGNDLLVTFTKHLQGQPKQMWSFRVTETGTVVPVDPSTTTQSSAKHEPFPGFPIPPPITNANPSIRLPLLVHVPTKLKVQRTTNMLSVEIDRTSLEATNLMVGTNMVIGVQSEEYVFPEGEPRPAYAKYGLGPEFNLGTSLLHTRPDGIPLPGKKYIVEVDLAVFETDVPPQHAWQPQGSKNYKVLWQRTLKQTVE